MKDHYSTACDIIDEARDVAADANVSFDQALQAIRIAALVELVSKLEAFVNETD